MEQELTFGGKSIGRVWAERQGLYYVFRCRCRLSGEAAFRLLATCGKNQEDLGILVPIDGGFGLDTRRPVKRLGEGTLAFSLVFRHDTPKTRFEPIYPEEPYAYLQKRKDAYLAVKSARQAYLLSSTQAQCRRSGT